MGAVYFLVAGVYEANKETNFEIYDNPMAIWTTLAKK